MPVQDILLTEQETPREGTLMNGTINGPGTYAARLLLAAMPAIIAMSDVRVAAAETPLITRVEPTEIVAGADRSMRVVLIRGYNIWVGPSGYDEYAKRTQVFIRRDGAFQPIRTYGHGYWTGTDQQELTLNVPGRDWFDKPGTFEVMVKVDGMESNYYQMPVLAGPPRIWKVTPDRLTLSGDENQRHDIRIRAANLGNPINLSVSLDGKLLDRCVLSPGVVQAFVPEAVFRKGGQYNLRVRSVAGESSPFALKLVEPPVKIQRTPGKFQVVPGQAPIPPPIQRK